MAPFEIRLMDEKIVFDDIIEPIPEQIALILKESPKMTQKQRLSEDSKGIKIPLTDKQRSKCNQLEKVGQKR